MQPMINMALSLARTGSEKAMLASPRLDRLNIISSDPSDFSSNMDYEINETMISGLRKAYPTHSIKSRIGEPIVGLEAEPRWFIDPLFGSLNFFKGNPCYGVSVAIEVEGEIKHSVLILPEYDQEFVASKGSGAQLNKTKCRVNPKGRFENSLLGVCLGHDAVHSSMKLATLFSKRNTQIRMSGCPAFDMLMVCANKLGGGYCEASKSNSERAATLVLSESGALISSETGNPNLANAFELCFGGPRIFREIVKLRKQI